MLLVTTTNNNGSISARQNNAAPTRTTSITRCRQSMGSSRHKRSRSSTSRSSTKYHEIRARKLANIHPLQLFRIVQDVDHYAQFLPLCYHSKVDPSSIAHNGQTFHAELVIGFGSLSSNYGPFTMQQSTVPSSSSSSSSLFTTRYISRVTVDPNELTISTISDGSIIRNDDDIDNDDEHNTTNMFESLSSYWKLRPYYNSATAANNSDNISSPIAGTEVDFKVEMGGVSDPIVAAVLNQMLYTVAETQVNAFQQRCYAVPPPTRQELELAEHFYPTRWRIRIRIRCFDSIRFDHHP